MDAADECQRQLFPAPPPSALPPKFMLEARIHLMQVPECGDVEVETFGQEDFEKYKARHAELLRDPGRNMCVFAFFGTQLNPPEVVETVVAESPWQA